MKKVILFSIITSLQLIPVSKVWAETHKLIVTNFTNDTYNMDIETKTIGTNGSAQPGLFIHASSDKDLGYDSNAKWVKVPSNIESKLLGERALISSQQTLPVRIIFSGKDPLKASEIMAKLIKNSPDKLQFSFDAREGKGAFTPRTVTLASLPKDDSARSGSIRFQQLEYQIPESEVTVKNLKTNQVMKLSDYIDANFDRSFKTAIKEFFSNRFIDKSVRVADPPREPKRAINFDKIIKDPVTKEARDR